MSTLWTPSGEHEPTRGEPAPPAGGGPGGSGPPGGPPGPASPPGEPDEAALREEMRRVRAELAGTAVADLVANHAIGLWQLAVLHLTPEEGTPVDLAEAGLAVDAMGALVEGLGDRLGENAQPLRDALAQLRLAFVQVSERAGATGGTGPGDPPAAADD